MYWNVHSTKSNNDNIFVMQYSDKKLSVYKEHFPKTRNANANFTPNSLHAWVVVRHTITTLHFPLPHLITSHQTSIVRYIFTQSEVSIYLKNCAGTSSIYDARHCWWHIHIDLHGSQTLHMQSTAFHNTTFSHWNSVVTWLSTKVEVVHLYHTAGLPNVQCAFYIQNMICSISWNGTQ